MIKPSKGLVKKNTFVKFEKESAKMRMAGGSWTLNLDYLEKEYGWSMDRASMEDSIKQFKYITKRCTYTISAFDAVMGGFVLNLRGENKLVVPIKLWRES
jgi:hypothetical protein